ncbi:hypothetical protein B0H10DRAFT_869213 [Mycena sp. CBHHK59/15]|nr:hypothetical protein B0H10DRAFT_869213 [Mycena sp. CBHHK59/15]
MGDGWVGVGVGVEEEREQEEDLEEGEDGAGYEDEGFSEVLADAILKRPESIRVRSKKGRERDRDRDQPPAEFTFPSISDFGNVSVNGAYRHVRSEPPAAAASPERAEAEAEAEAGENAAAP